MTSAKVVICSCHGERVFVGRKLIGGLDLKKQNKKQKHISNPLSFSSEFTSSKHFKH